MHEQRRHELQQPNKALVLSASLPRTFRARTEKDLQRIPDIGRITATAHEVPVASVTDIPRGNRETRPQLDIGGLEGVDNSIDRFGVVIDQKGSRSRVSRLVGTVLHRHPLDLVEQLERALAKRLRLLIFWNRPFAEQIWQARQYG